MANTYRLKVDLKLNKTGIVPTFVQYDDARLEFEIFDNGKPFDYTGFTLAEFAHKKPDGTSVIADGAIETDLKGKRIVAYDYQGSEMSKAGFVETSFSIFNDAQEKVSILPFKVKMVADLRDEAFDPASPEFGKLQRYAAELQALKTDMQNKINESVAATNATNDVITTGNQLNTDLSALKASTETVRDETFVVKTDTLSVKDATQIVQDETLAVKNVTQEVQAATETVRANTDAVRLETITAKDETIAATGLVTEAVDNANAISESWTYVGDYNLNTAYEKHNVVTLNGEGYIAKQDVTGVAPTNQESDQNWRLFARKGVDGTGTVVRHRQVFSATANQTIFTLSKTYDQFQNRIDVTVGGIPQFSPDNFAETTNNSITLSEGVPVGTEVIVTYFSQAVPLATDLETKVNNNTATISSHTTTIESHTTQINQHTTDIGNKVDKVTGKGLSTNDYTTNEKNKLAGLSQIALNNTTTSTSTTEAATANAVKTAYDRAEAAFQSASDGKTLISNAITGKGVTSSSTDTFQVLADNITAIPVGAQVANGTLPVGTFTITAPFPIDFIVLIVETGEMVSFAPVAYRGFDTGNGYEFTQGNVTATFSGNDVTLAGTALDEPVRWIAIGE